MNILFMSNSLGKNFGYSVVADRVSDALQKANNQVFFLGMQDCGPPWVRDNGVVNLGIRYDPWGGDCLESYCTVFKADCFCSMLDVWLPQTAYMPIMTRKLKIPFVCHVTINTEPLSPVLAARLTEADVLVAPSKYNLRVLQEGGLGHKSVYIPHGVDTSVFKPNKKSREEMRRRLRIGDKSFVVLSVNRNKGPQKRLPDLMKAWRVVLDREPILRKEGVLLMLHDPHEPDGFRTDYFRDRIMLQENMKYIWAKPTPDYNGMLATYDGDPEGMRHNANINFLADEMAKIYNVGDIHVVPCAGESFSLPTIESMASGVPCIMGNHSTAPELIGESGGGLLADVAYAETNNLISDTFCLNPESLADKIQMLYKDDKLREECGRKALEHAKKYDWELIMPQWVKLMDDVKEMTLRCDYATGKLGV